MQPLNVASLEFESAETKIGRTIREIRTRKGLSLRILAEQSGLNINTLSLVENGRCSPSVSTLHQLAMALDVPIVSFFETEPDKKKIVFNKAGDRDAFSVGNAMLINLAEDLRGGVIQPFKVILGSGQGSGERMIVHNGHEFVYCLTGAIRYIIQNETYELGPGDSVAFEANIPHCWKNHGSEPAEILLILVPSEKEEESGGNHFL